VLTDELTTTLTTNTTRRTIVKTGVKLAYAVPLVAATFKLSAGQTFAADACTAGENCAEGTTVNCGANGFCACVANVDGGFACVDRMCSFTPCSTGTDCDSGLCISAPGCCGDPNPFCATPCTDGVSGGAGGASTDWH
jgi:hypothetical protein